MKIKYYKELDGVRGIAAMMVMFFHFFQSQLPTNKILSAIIKMSIFGQTGVILFFVLSGFLITRILLSTKNSKHYYSNFYIRRSLRIFPLYYLYLIIAFFIIPYIQSSDIIPLNLQIYHWIYLQNFALTFNWPHEGPIHFWSLAVEEHFYLFWPILVYILDEKNLMRCSMLLIVIALIVRFFLLQNGYDIFYFTFTNIDSLAIGTILGIIEYKNNLLRYKSFFSVGLAISILGTITLWLLSSQFQNNIIQILKPIFLNTVYFSLIGYILNLKHNNIIVETLSSKPFKYIGTISYGLYVYHPICFAIIMFQMQEYNILLTITTCFFASFIIASISYYFFELKFITLKDRLTLKS